MAMAHLRRHCCREPGFRRSATLALPNYDRLSVPIVAPTGALVYVEAGASLALLLIIVWFCWLVSHSLVGSDMGGGNAICAAGNGFMCIYRLVGLFSALLFVDPPSGGSINPSAASALDAIIGRSPAHTPLASASAETDRAQSA
jgi:hypothetical protein